MNRLTIRGIVVLNSNCIFLGISLVYLMQIRTIIMATVNATIMPKFNVLIISPPFHILIIQIVLCYCYNVSMFLEKFFKKLKMFIQ